MIDLDKEELNNINLLNGLKLVGDYLEKIILKPNNINYPTERLDFINILKWSQKKKKTGTYSKYFEILSA